MLVKNGTAFIGGHFTRADVRVENGKIAQIGDLQPREGEEIRSAAGLYVLPGLVDIHIHAYAGADCMRGEDDVRRMSEGLLKTGVAAFMPTTMSAPIEATNRALRAIQAVRDMPCEKGAAVLGAHMEAPFLCEKYKGAQLGECLMNPSVEAYEAMTRGTDCVRMMTLAPELPGALDMVADLKARGVVTCAAHSNATAEEVHAAADRGLTQITHLFNAQSPLHHRKPGVPGAAGRRADHRAGDCRRAAPAPGYAAHRGALQGREGHGADLRFDGGSGHAGRAIRPRRAGGIR